MQNKLYKILKIFFRNRRVHRFTEKFIIRIARFVNVNLLSLAYSEIGILNFKNAIESGEHYLISTWLKSHLEANGIEKPVFFDVGANIGSYTKLLSDFIPNSRIYAFEPNTDTFQQLYALSQKNANILAYNTALGSSVGSLELFIREDNASSTKATFYHDVLTKIHKYDDVLSSSVPVDTIDHFCSQNHIARIDLLKIDTEGHELQVLLGAKKTLESGKILSIQFEFNEMNIYSRSFLRDFFDILYEFNIYRLLPRSLLPINYSSGHEIFLFQNLLAIRKDQDLRTSKSSSIHKLNHQIG